MLGALKEHIVSKIKLLKRVPLGIGIPRGGLGAEGTALYKCTLLYGYADQRHTPLSQVYTVWFDHHPSGDPVVSVTKVLRGQHESILQGF